MSLNTTTITGMGALAKWTNTAVGGILFDGAMLVFFVIIIIIYLKSADNPDFESAFTVTSFIMFIPSLFLWVGELLDGIIPLLFLIFTAIGVLYLYTKNR